MGNHVSKELAELGLGPRGVAQAQETASSPQTCSKETGRGLEGALVAPTQPPPSGAQQGSKEGLGGWAGDPCPHKPPSAWPDAFGAWRQGLENGAAINSVQQHREAVKPARQRLECGGIQEGFSGGSGLIASLGPWGQRGARLPPLPLPAILLLFPFPSPAPPLPHFCSCIHESLPLLGPSQLLPLRGGSAST